MHCLADLGREPDCWLPGPVHQHYGGRRQPLGPAALLGGVLEGLFPSTNLESPAQGVRRCGREMYVHPNEGGDGFRVEQEHRATEQLGHHTQ